MTLDDAVPHAQSDAPVVRYALCAHRPDAHLFRVVLRLDGPALAAARADDGSVELWLPVWIPGSYMVREFARNVVRLAAQDSAGAVPMVKVDKTTWRTAPGHDIAGSLEVVYELYGWELSVRAAHLDRTHGFCNGTSVFLAVRGLADAPHAVEIVAPSHPACAAWRVATSLPRDPAVPEQGLYDYGHFLAADYDDLIDHPIEQGTFTTARFEVAGVPHDMVITGRHRADMARLCDDAAVICQAQADVYGGTPPVDRYLFLLTVVGKGYGGLEHRSSTALICDRADLPLAGVHGVSEGYRRLLGLISHEYVHTWNVKRIKPKAFVPYDLRKEQYTQLLWAFEGITSYYDDLGLLRAERIPTKEWLQLVGQTWTRVRRGPGRLSQPVGDSSFDAWTKFYRQDENAPNAIVSYYAKGSLVALALDLHLRRVTDERVGLDTLMAGLWARYGDGSGVPEDGIEVLAAELAGQDLSGFFDHAVRGVEDLPLQDLLSWVGVDVGHRIAKGSKDAGGTPPPKGTQGGGLVGDPLKVAVPSDLGCKLTHSAAGAKVASVLDGSAAMQAGVSAGDVIVAVDGLRVTAASLTAQLGVWQAGAPMTVHLFRRDELMVLEVIPQVPELSTVWLSLDAQADEATVARRERWLAGQTL